MLSQDPPMNFQQKPKETTLCYFFQIFDLDMKAMDDTSKKPLDHSLLLRESTTTPDLIPSDDERTSFLSDNNEKSYDIEKGTLTLQPKTQKKRSSSFKFLAWTVVNTLATIGIVS
jgi:carboxypeptidase C (cathepsin A)